MMKFSHRRQILRQAAGAVALPLLSRIARAQPYPTRPVRWIVPYPPGGPADVVARLVGQYMSERLGQPFVIENKAGAGANIGTEAVIKSAPDGYTLLLISTANVINTSLYSNLSFNFSRDIAPVAGLVRLPMILEVNPSLPARTVPEFVSYAKSAQVNYASSGVGTSIHLASELFKSMTGIEMTHVPYRGGAPALTDLIGGRVQVMFDNLSNSLEHIRSGKLRALAVTTATRLDALPDVPTIGETVRGYEASSVFGVGVPTGTPVEVIRALNREVNAALRDPGIRAKLIDLASVPIPEDQDNFRAELAATTEKWGRLIKTHGIKPE
jgi:tripartite-type tricarboxylate transporter receptor subunit TctC